MATRKPPKQSDKKQSQSKATRSKGTVDYASIPEPQMSPRGEQLWNKTIHEYSLDDVGLALLKIACLSLSESELAAEILDREGRSTVNPSSGAVRQHPMCSYLKDQRTLAAGTLAKLALQLED